MTTCCHCGRILYYRQSVKRHSGSWCYYNKGACSFDYNYAHDESEEGQEDFKRKLIKGIAKGAIIGAALGVTCLLVHVACIITAFIHQHYYFKSAASSVYSVLKNKSEHDNHPVKEAAISGTLETSNAAGTDALSSKLGAKFAEIAHARSGASLSWAGEIGKETGRGMLEQGSSAVFDWGSKVVV